MSTTFSANWITSEPDGLPLKRAAVYSIAAHLASPLLVLLLGWLASLFMPSLPPVIGNQGDGDITLTLVKQSSVTATKPQPKVSPPVQAKVKPPVSATIQTPVTEKPPVQPETLAAEVAEPLTQPATPPLVVPTEVSQAAPASATSLANEAGTTGAAGEDHTEFGPYLSDLRQQLTHNWQPFRGDSSESVTVIFEIDRDGKLLQVAIQQSSGHPKTDEAALLAVEQSAPFAPLPASYSGQSVPILFTFDYTILGLSHRSASLKPVSSSSSSNSNTR